ncbi:uncharacterized protein N0V89_008784 [Didymosphaeria variabile]|uniref:Xylanolytic transcriptional activator regulatory domain-containing protein n=1 Tax=Didymosphaeria variabile TaxID=1932322 RepID=A0A9W8XGV9_9PLEO|nr:uncharacterized protein N0V89_008784 [Didymosphaeria variabile]KAJ4350163.1 hypothetical protein N0V89_008784 [Didymosphaeria variabile]
MSKEAFSQVSQYIVYLRRNNTHNYAGYIRTLELALTWLFQNTDCEAVLNKKLAQEGTSSVLFGRDTKESNRLHKSWRRSRFCKDVDKLLSGEQLGPSDDPSPRSDDEDSEPEAEQPGLQDQISVLPQEDEVSPSAHFASPRVPLSIQQGTLIPSKATELPASIRQQPVAATPLPGSTWRLLEIYFAYTQSWLPICEKHDLLRVSYSYPEAGLVLSGSDLPNHGDHAELWSVLAVAAHQERMLTQEQERDILQDPARLYSVARSLIPTESDSFAVGHVRALLNLAVVNLASGNTEVAWLLVGSASRIVIMIERSSQIIPTRWKHLLAGCFMLDSFLSIHLQRRPYLLRSDVIRSGSVEEDGLEEWQPWNAPLNSSSSIFSRTPALSLSSFNKLTEIVEILNMCNLDGATNPPSTPQQILHQLESWKASLSTKFNYISDELKATPLNPPAILLQLTYLSCVSSLLTSPSHMQRMTELLTQYLAQLGIAAMPPIVLCLLAHVQANRMFGTLDPRLQSSIRNYEADVVRAWAATRGRRSAPTPVVPAQTRASGAAYQIPTPESIQVPFNPSYTPLENPPRVDRPRASASLLDDLLPDMNPAISAAHRPPTKQGFRMPSAEEDPRRPLLRHRNSAASRDLETFFDELASLDGAEMVDNQPQFMQNLGFAPDANMADFLALELGQYIPANSSTFMPQNNDPTHLDPAFFDGT